MNCNEFCNMSDAAQLQHAGECPSCAAVLRRHQTLTTALRAVADDMRHIEAPPRVEGGLLAAFRAQQRAQRRTAPVQWWAPAFSWAASAAVLAGIAVLLLRPPHMPLPAHRATPGVVEMASDVDANSPADDDGFIPLPNAQKLDPEEDVNVVRMEVPRSTMMSVGLAVSADRVSELVEADVVLGADGMARAIRFVDE